METPFRGRKWVSTRAVSLQKTLHLLPHIIIIIYQLIPTLDETNLSNTGIKITVKEEKT
jgi:hypothetical protein